MFYTNQKLIIMCSDTRASFKETFSLHVSSVEAGDCLGCLMAAAEPW